MEPVQLEFDFEFDELPPTRPLPYYPAPKNDNEKLLNWQYEYRIKGDEKALNKMYRLGEIIALRYINTVAKKNKAVAKLAQCDKEEKAHNAITYIIARYLRVKDFAVQKSFTAYLYLRIQHELFYQRKVDKIVDFVDMETFYRGAK
jgi:hypothetical protein